MSFPRPCAGCMRTIASGTYCPDCEPTFKAAARARAEQPYRRHYGTAEYRRNRARRLEQCGGVCEMLGCRLAAAECDHLITVRDWEMRGLPGSPNQLSNLRWLCKGHHNAKTAEDRRARR